jgi:hypothetical protein
MFYLTDKVSESLEGLVNPEGEQFTLVSVDEEDADGYAGIVLYYDNKRLNRPMNRPYKMKREILEKLKEDLGIGCDGDLRGMEFTGYKNNKDCIGAIEPVDYSDELLENTNVIPVE